MSPGRPGCWRLLCLLGLLVAAVAVADVPLEEVLVTGQQPGPGLWKVTRAGEPDGSVLWILGDYSPLPKRMKWRSRELESRLATSQELLAPVSVSASVGPLGGITLLPSLIGAKRNPDGARLQDAVPPELYARWLPLKARFIGDDDDVEEWRPIFAAAELYKAALKANGLVPYEGVWPEVERLARRAHVKVEKPEVEFKFEKARAAIKEFKRLPLDDVECFARTIQRLETDLDLMRERARAWAVGDVARLRQLVPVERAGACIGAILDSRVMQERGLGDVPARVKSLWVDSAVQALSRNRSTVAVLTVDQILKPDGYVARLKELGYVVTDP